MKRALLFVIPFLAGCSSAEEREREARAARLPSELASFPEKQRTVLVAGKDYGADLRFETQDEGRSLRLTPTARSASRSGESVSIRFHRFESFSIDSRSQGAIELEIEGEVRLAIRPVAPLHWGEVFFAADASALELEISKLR